MNWANLLWIFYFAAHTAAGILYLLLGMVMYGVREAGLWNWTVPGVCLVLLVMDLTGRISLRGSAAKTLAALFLPLLCGYVELLFWDGYGLDGATPAAVAWVFAKLLLAAYVLLREEKPKSPEVLLERGSAMGVAGAVWLVGMAGAVLFMASFGLPVSLLVGGLISSRNSLLDYCGVKGILSGLLALYVLQCLWYCRGARLVQGDELERNDSIPLISLFIPFWNQAQARKLARLLQMRGVKGYY